MHKVLAFIAPKLIGGGGAAPTPLGELGAATMGDALPLCDASWALAGGDMLCAGYLPASGGLAAVAAAAGARAGAAAAAAEAEQPAGAGGAVRFYKAWDAWGALSNFSPHPVTLADAGGGGEREWPTVEARAPPAAPPAPVERVRV